MIPEVYRTYQRAADEFAVLPSLKAVRMRWKKIQKLISDFKEQGFQGAKLEAEVTRAIKSVKKYSGTGDHFRRFTDAEEELMAVFIGEYRDRGFYFNQDHLVELADIIRKDETEDDRPVTEKWVKEFLGHHPEVKLAKASGVDYQRLGGGGRAEEKEEAEGTDQVR